MAGSSGCNSDQWSSPSQEWAISSSNVRFDTFAANSARNTFWRNPAIFSKPESLDVNFPSGINPSVNHSRKCLRAKGLESIREDSGIMHQDAGSAIKAPIWMNSNRDWITIDGIEAELDAFVSV